MSGAGVSQHKLDYVKKAADLFSKYDTFYLVNCDNIGSKHMQSIRRMLYPYDATLLMGKNSLLRKAVTSLLEEKPQLEQVLPHIVGNIGFIFTSYADTAFIRKEIESSKVGAPAKAGAIAPCDVTIPKGNTGLEPTQTSFLQALNIATKIAKGQIEILNPVHLIVEGQKVGSSEAVLLQKMKIMPFSYGIVVKMVFEDGSLFPAAALDCTEEDIVAKFLTGVNNVAAIGLALGMPNTATVPHHILKGFKNIFAISLVTDVPVTYPQIKSVKDLMNDPEAMAAAAAAAAAASSSSAAPAAAAAAAEEPAAEEESDEDMGFGLFD